MQFQNFLKVPSVPISAFERPWRGAVDVVANTNTPTYRSLLGEAGWNRLDPAIRSRFGEESRDRSFYGLMTTVRLSRAGRALALLSRLFGRSLCPKTGRHIVTKIDVAGEAGDTSGTWNRSYLLPAGRRYTVTSVKRFDPRDGLLECLGRGFVMRLDLKAQPDALHFVSVGYAWHAGPVKISLPRLLSPGDTHVIHRELGGGRFRFTLSIVHPWLGELAFQEGDFFEREARPWNPS